MFFRLNGAYVTECIGCYDVTVAFCNTCKRQISESRYDGCVLKADKFVYLTDSSRSKGISRWPMAIQAGLYKMAIHQDVVIAIMNAGIDSVRFHEVKEVRGDVLKKLALPAPNYYLVEPLGIVEFEPSPEDFKILDCVCKLEGKNWGKLTHPLAIRRKTYDEADFFRVNHFYHWIMASKQVIDILVINGWTSDFSIGDQAMPGIKVTEFGPDWYEKAEARVKLLHPNYKVFV